MYTYEPDTRGYIYIFRTLGSRETCVAEFEVSARTDLELHMDAPLEGVWLEALTEIGPLLGSDHEKGETFARVVDILERHRIYAKGSKAARIAALKAEAPDPLGGSTVYVLDGDKVRVDKNAFAINREDPSVLRITKDGKTVWLRPGVSEAWDFRPGRRDAMHTSKGFWGVWNLSDSRVTYRTDSGFGENPGDFTHVLRNGAVVWLRPERGEGASEVEKPTPSIPGGWHKTAPDCLPEPNEVVVVCVPGSGMEPYYCTATLDESLDAWGRRVVVGWWSMGSATRSGRVKCIIAGTYWMRLPSPPKED